MSATSIAIGVAAGATAVSSAQRADQRTQECNTLLSHYDSGKATIEEMRAYSDCVYHIHGTQKGMSEAEILVAKILVFGLFVLAIWGFFWGASDRGGILGGFVGAFVFQLVGFLVFLFLILIISGISFLFS